MKYALKEEEVSKFMGSLKIHNDDENDKAILHLEQLTDSFESGETDLEPLIDYLTSLIVKYEDEKYPIENPSPVELLRHLMEQHGHKQTDLSDVASRTVINEILNGKRQLNLGHIRRLSDKYGVSPEIFI